MCDYFCTACFLKFMHLTCLVSVIAPGFLPCLGFCLLTCVCGFWPRIVYKSVWWLEEESRKIKGTNYEAIFNFEFQSWSCHKPEFRKVTWVSISSPMKQTCMMNLITL
jgi:hypothetical protein